VVAITGCRENIAVDEKTYKETTTELAKLLDGYLDIKLDYEKSEIWSEGNKEYPVGQKIVYDADDIQKRERYFEKNRERWLELDLALKEFSVRFPESAWADDAAFYRAVEFMIAKIPYKILKEFHIDSLEIFLSDYKKFNIEGWTKERIGHFYRPIFDIEPSDSESTENAKIRGTFYTMRIIQHCLDKDFNGAEAALKRLEAERLPVNAFAENCRIIIDMYRKEST
jgi:hypothetical protein